MVRLTSFTVRLISVLGFMVWLTGCSHFQQGNVDYVDRKLGCVKELLEKGVEAVKSAQVCGDIYDRK
jgi:hypothetical protein